MIKLLLLLLTLCTGLIWAQDTTTPERLKKLFEWGEYDSLIIHATTACSTKTTGETALQAEYHKYLGVAHCARSAIDRGRSHFRHAFYLNNDIALETYYVSPEIAGLFSSTIDECKKKVEADSLAAITRINAVRNQQILDSISRDRHRRTSTALAATSFSIAALCALATAYEYWQTGIVYDEFLSASARGARLRYEQLKPSIRQGDIITVCAAIATTVFAGYGTYITLTMPRLFLQTQKLTLVPIETGTTHGVMAYVLF